MHFEQTIIPDVITISPKRIGDTRGHFMETFRQALFVENVADFNFVQENQSFSAQVGTVRGLHFQMAPKAQGKLLRCISGAILDVALDIRKGSPTYGQHVAIELTAENGKQLWVPPGFAHGFCTLAPNTEVSYKLTDYYSVEHDRGVLWSDPTLKIDWPIDAAKAVVSDKDKRHPVFSELRDAFTY